jgi:hypothetical protein
MYKYIVSYIQRPDAWPQIDGLYFLDNNISVVVHLH